MCTLVINDSKAELWLLLKKESKELFPFVDFRRKMTLTSVAAADDVRKVSESFVAVVPLAAAEEHLRVFLHGDTLLPKRKQQTCVTTVRNPPLTAAKVHLRMNETNSLIFWLCKCQI